MQKVWEDEHGAMTFVQGNTLWFISSGMPPHDFQFQIPDSDVIEQDDAISDFLEWCEASPELRHRTVEYWRTR